MTVDQRLARLERSVWRHRVAMLVLLALVVGPPLRRSWFPEKTTIPDLITARRVSVIDEIGNERLALEVDKQVARIELRDSTGLPQVQLDVTAAGPGLTLCDEHGQVRAFLAVMPEGPYLGMTSPDGTDIFTAPLAGEIEATPNDKAEQDSASAASEAE